MSGAPSGPNQSFQDRLNRVAQHRSPSETEAPISVLPDLKSRVSGKLALLLAVVVGVLAVVIVRVARFHFTGEAMIGGNPDTTLAIETAAALALSFVVFALFPYKGVQYKFVQFGGVVLMISMMHNAVHATPSVFNAAFSPEWTTTVTELTEPNSLYLRGEIIPFVKDADDAELAEGASDAGEGTENVEQANGTEQPDAVEEADDIQEAEEVEEEKKLPPVRRL